MRAVELMAILAGVHPDTQIGIWCPTTEAMFHVEEGFFGEEFGEEHGFAEIKDDDFVVLQLSGHTYGHTIDMNGVTINESPDPN